MRAVALAGCLVLASLAARAEETRAPSGLTVPACDSLVALRQLAAEAGEDSGRAATLIGQRPGCRLVPRDGIGTIERRATFGGTIYECYTQGAGACVWVMP